MREKNENDMKESEEEIRWSKDGLEKVMREKFGGRDCITLEIRDIDVNERRDIGGRMGGE